MKGAAEQEKSECYAPLTGEGLECVEFCVTTGGSQLPVMIVSPAKDKISPDPVLLLAVGSPKINFLCPPISNPARYFLEHGHRVVCFPVSVIESSLEVFRDCVLEGPDPTMGFIADAKAVLEYCVDRKWARPGRIVVTGVSRNAYLAFRLMAADDRLDVGGGFAPVTDWRDLSEFRDQKEMEAVADLRLSLFADKLAGKHVFMTIGSHDERVNTLSCCQFFLDLNAANAKRGFDKDCVNLYLTPDENHSCGDEWYRRGMEILLDWIVAKK